MSAQLEDGYTKVAHELLEQIPFFKFNGTQFSLLLVIIRYTYGFNRKDHDMSLTFLTNATGIKRTQVDRELTSLIEKKVVLVTKESTKTDSRRLGLNKHYEKWQIDKRCPLIRGQYPKKSIPELEDRESPNQGTEGIPYLGDQEINLLNKSLNKLDDVDNAPELKMVSEIENHFIKRRAKGTQITNDDFKMIKEIVLYGISIEFIKSTIDQAFDEYKPRFPKDSIKSFSYIEPICYDRWTRLQEKVKPFPKGGQANAKHGSGHGGYTDEQLNTMFTL